MCINGTPGLHGEKLAVPGVSKGNTTFQKLKVPFFM